MVEQSLEEVVVFGGFALRPHLRVLSHRAALDDMTKNCSAVDALHLEPVLDPQHIRPDHPERPDGTGAMELLPEHRSGLVQAMPSRAGSGAEVRRPETVEVFHKLSDPFWRRRDRSFVAIVDLHVSPHSYGWSSVAKRLSSRDGDLVPGG